MYSSRVSATLPGLVCIAVVCVTLSLGLWPFHSPANQVSWLPKGDGVQFGKAGTILGSELKLPPSSGATIEMWVQPERWASSAALLALYNPQRDLLFMLHQSLTDLEVEVQRPNSHFEVKDALAPSLRRKKPVFLSVTSGSGGTRVYLDGVLARQEPGFSIPQEAFAGRIIVGDAPGQSDSYRGKIFGLALYRATLSADEILHSYRNWTRHMRPDSANNGMVALYLFGERSGNLVRDQVNEAHNLWIPTTYTVVDQTVFEPFWQEFEMSTAYWRGNLKNVIGLVPLGFCLYAYFTVVRPIRRATLVTVLSGTLVSLTIEGLQALLPTRDSGTTDIFTNTLGTWLGIVLFRKMYPLLAKNFPGFTRFIG